MQAAPAGNAARRLLALAVACAVLVGLLYVFFVCTRLGQRIDDAAVRILRRILRPFDGWESI